MAELSDKEFEVFQVLAKKLLGIHLTESKKTLVYTRIGSRLRALKLNTYTDYINYLSRSNTLDELQQFVNAITTNETYFFREKHHFDLLKDTLLPYYQQKVEAGDSKDIRIWCAASSSGEEPYTIALTVLDYFRGKANKTKILASDVNSYVLNLAHNGQFKIDGVKGDIPAHLKSKYFKDLGEHRYQISDEVKNLVRFKKINLLNDKYPIREKVDIIFCRNVMIYFDDVMREHVLKQFHHYLADDGVLIMGHSENLLKFSHLFKLRERTIYEKVL
jgi:chemotaxis protein methyltransferase CheR